MKKTTFKAGDLVYYPRATNKILRLVESNRALTGRPLAVAAKFVTEIPKTFFRQGKHNLHYLIPDIFHATRENQKKLEQMYGIVLEKPKESEPKTVKQIIQEMLSDGWKSVPCRCAIHKNKDGNYTLLYTDFIINVGDSTRKLPFESVNENYEIALPFDPKTGKSIIDYIDGEMVLNEF